ncbi:MULTISPECIES: substrate-binding periplasmic protein [Stutzerimonas]|jgi:polar amino acid transport system substrate-binding protein|uniref:Amino acid ABC transporter substrate-binding protein n=2 Tax=Stutzerimonas balearica TaxID=74829 RepID=A0A8D3XXW4_9GAMM|nr:ABC transporter substrate-binding protein [Stutzerimonas balearica]KIL03649.1 amino acid ABC transporter substrate-binding protein [Stutzerimonas stutzeri]MBZ5754577.1 ABC transporter substrate-binding protein [Pseudomonas sp. S5(2021)]HCW95536.1 amino acid ABC transporter substrate-binding protein [Pseudomonas sp.]AJE13713.1 amino acid ABC transporter substrate-binding protein [Stutzerimonas balearica DSM 6083]MBD3738049.1 ABC transporter substrate-binding protein [Stutzerimonas balearica]
MFKALITTMAATLLGCTLAHAEPTPRIDLLTENFPPYNMAEDGKNFARDEHISGIAADIVREMFQRAGIEYTLTLRFPWERIYKMTLDNPDYGIFVTARLPEREALFKWVGPIGPDDWVLLARADSPITLRSLDEARQYQIGAYKGDAIAEHLEGQGLQPQLALRDQENVKKLIDGKIDLWATGDPAGRYLARQDGVTGLKRVLRFDSAELYLALNKQVDDQTVQRLQQALDQMRADGTVDAINARYLD